MKAGGRGRGDTLAQDCAKVKDHRAPKSAAATAAVVGTSSRKVEQARDNNFC